MENPDNYLSIKQVSCRMGAKMKILGMVDIVRNQGGLIFIDIREKDNLIQALIIPDNIQAYAMAQKISKGYTVEVKGVIKECPESVQSEEKIRKIEMEVEKISIISARSEKENKSKRILDRSRILSGNNKNKIM